MSKPRIVMYITRGELSYIPRWKSLFLKYFSHVDVTFGTPLTLAEVDYRYPTTDWVVCTNHIFLKKLVETHATLQDKSPSIDDYAGSIFPLKPGSNKRVLITRNLDSFFKYPFGEFLMEQHLAKIFDPDRFLPDIPFSWEVVNPQDVPRIQQTFASAEMMAVDVETIKDIAWPTQQNPKARKLLLAITECGFAGLFKDKATGGYRIHVAVIPYTSMALINCARNLLQYPIPKVMHNGHYDCSYFMRYNQPPVQYYYDTYHLQHCAYAELPKSLGFTACFWMRNVQYWKEDRKSPNLETKLLYNAKDCYNTLCSLLNMMHRPPEWLFRNYEKEFKMVFPALTAGTHGLRLDMERRNAEKESAMTRANEILAQLRNFTRAPEFNPSSSQQVLRLYKALTFGKAQSTDAKQCKTLVESGKYPLFDRIFEMICEFREEVKAVTTYFGFDTLADRWLYKVDVAGTETGRSASKASDFWVGTQIQNAPGYAKCQVIADPGWRLAELDKKASESYCTGYLAQEPGLIDAVENSPDFHCKNASMFFGIPFSELFQEEHYDQDGNFFPAKVLRKDIRTLAKRVNHGANYNMGSDVLVATMGTKAIFQAAHLLNLPSIWGPKSIASYLLGRFALAYPKVKGDFQKEIIHEVRSTGLLVLPNGWTRKCFGKPHERKPDLNAYVAHKPQSLSVHLVNEGWFQSWLNLQIRPWLTTGVARIRTLAQIHDSHFFMHREEDSEVVHEVNRYMRIPIEIYGRIMDIPNDVKYGAERWSDLKD